jgi:diamine N-acetyltransferase
VSLSGTDGLPPHYNLSQKFSIFEIDLFKNTMNDAVEIVQSSPNQTDARTIALLGRLTFSETFGHLFTHVPNELEAYLDNTFGVNKIQNSILKENNIFYIAYYQNLPVGYLKLKKYMSIEGLENSIQLQKVYVLKDFLSKNIGKPLLEKAFEEAHKLHKNAMWLIVLESNSRAIRAYEKQGFEKKEKRTFRIGSQDFIFDLMVRIGFQS